MVADVGCATTEGVEPSPQGGNKKEEPQERRAAQRLLVKRAKIMARKDSKNTNKQNLDGKPQEFDRTKKKKKKKYKSAPWLCQGVIVKSTAPISIRSDLDDALDCDRGKQEVSYYTKWEECFCEDFDSLSVETCRRNIRTKKSNISAKETKNIPSLNFRTRQRLQEAVRGGHGKHSFINSDFLSRLKAQDDERNYAKERIADNTRARLERRVVKRLNELAPPKPEANSSGNNTKTKSNCKPTSRHSRLGRKSRWSQERKEERVRVPHEFELRVEHVAEQDDPDETNMMCFLLDLQNREMTPEDYDMLLRLDDQLAPKTVGSNTLASLRSVTVSTSDAPVDDDVVEVTWSDALCSVCMEGYASGQVVKFLPCEHFYHSHCIEMWLNNSGNTCPLDGLELS